MTKEELKEQDIRLNKLCFDYYEKDKQITELEKENTELKEKIEKVEYTLKKIIETVQNDRIDEYGARLVLIKDFAYECLQEIEK